ncbi:MAG: histidine kinase [Treponema sp.]|nr:histidine kinase [Treponema sp.]
MHKPHERKIKILSGFIGLYRFLLYITIFIILFVNQDSFIIHLQIRYFIFLSCCAVLNIIFAGHVKIQITLLSIEYFTIYCYAYAGSHFLPVELISIPPVIVALAFILPSTICPIIIIAAGIIGPFLFSYGIINHISVMIGNHPLSYTILVLSIYIPISLLSILLNSIYNQKENAGQSYANLDLENRKLNQINQAISQRIFSLQNDTAQKERNRLSKEIHDTAGYVFINLIMMLQATQAILYRDITKADKLISDARDYAERGINEIRYLLRDIRSYTPVYLSLQNELHNLGESFQKATDVDITIEYGNWPQSISKDLDSFFISFMQESLTNALKHGNASHVSVLCWLAGGQIGMSVIDNGSGAAIPINKGIGITAMEDVASQYGGSISIKSNGDFKITATLPVPNKLTNE